MKNKKAVLSQRCPRDAPDHTPTIRTRFAARKSICTIYYRLLGCMGKNKAKTAVSVAAEAKPEVEIWWRPKKSKERW